jgi:hypothetical protein
MYPYLCDCDAIGQGRELKRGSKLVPVNAIVDWARDPLTVPLTLGQQADTKVSYFSPVTPRTVAVLPLHGPGVNSVGCNRCATVRDVSGHIGGHQASIPHHGCATGIDLQRGEDECGVWARH